MTDREKLAALIRECQSHRGHASIDVCLENIIQFADNLAALSSEDATRPTGDKE